MKALEILLIVLCAAIVIGVIAASVIRKKKGRSACNCGSVDCPFASSCKGCEEKKKSEL